MNEEIITFDGLNQEAVSFIRDLERRVQELEKHYHEYDGWNGNVGVPFKTRRTGRPIIIRREE